jgi:tetratricopeptide (TPR) repeat protein
LLTERNQLFALAIAALQQPGAVVTNTATARCQQQILSRFLALQAGGLVAQGRVDEVQQLAQQAVALGAANDGWEGESFGYLAWGQSCYRQGKLAEAQQHFGQALTLARRYRSLLPALTLLNDVEATALIWLAGIAKDEGALPQAYDYLMAALQLCQTLGNVRSETRVRFNLASLAWVKRDYPTARQVYEQTLAMAQQVGDPLAAGICYLELGEVLRMQGDYGGAYQALAQAQTIFTRIGDFIQNAYAITCLGCLCVYLGDFTAAGHLHQQAAAYSDSLDSAIVKYQGLLLQALFAHISGEQRTAQTVAYNCWQVAQATKSSSRQARALVLLGHAAAALQDHPAAATAYEQAAILFDAMGYRTSAAAEAHAGLAALALQQGYPAQALALVTEFLPHLLDDSGVVGVDEPFYTYLTGYQVLVANEDSRAQALLQHGYKRLLTYADQIADPALRHSFLHNVPVHYALQQAYLTTR